MRFGDLVRAEMTLLYSDIFRRKSVLLMFIAYPYMLTLFILLIGYAFGTPQVFMERVGVRPEVFFLVGGYMMMTIIGVGDDLLWRPIFDEWMGTLPYILASPVDRVKHYFAIPVPRMILVLIGGAGSVVPVLVYYYGLSGLAEAVAVMALTGLAAFFFASVAVIITGILFTLGSENWRAINVVRPILFILIGVFYPRYLMPLTARLISGLIPSSHVVEVVQRILAGAYPGLIDFLTLIGLATALFIIYTPIGARSIAMWERKKVSEGVKT